MCNKGLNLTLNVTKTKAVLFSRSKKQVANQLSLKTSQGTIIEVVTEYKYLGFMLDGSSFIIIIILSLFQTIWSISQ